MMENLPVITIVTVVRNDKVNIEMTLKSVISQKRLLIPFIEYIVIDGKSNDGSYEIIQSYSSEINCIISEKDEGIYDAMNKGISYAKGNYIYFLNSGDFLHDNVLKQVLEVIERYPAIDVFYGHITYHFLFKQYNSYYTIKAQKDISLIEKGMIFCHQAAFTRRVLLSKFKFDTRYKFAADYNLFVELYLYKAKFFHLDFSIANYLDGGYSSGKLMLEFEYFLIQYSHFRKFRALTYFFKKIVWFFGYKGFMGIQRILFGSKYIFFRRVRRSNAKYEINKI